MKILVVSNMYPNEEYPFYGVFVERFCHEIKKIDIQYNLAVMYKKNRKYVKIFSYLIFYLKTFLCSLFGKYDLIYVHYASHSSIPVLCANKIKRLCIYTNVHGSDVVPENTKQQKMQKYTTAILKKSERIIVPSEYFRKYVSEKYKLDYSKIYVFPSAGVDANIFFPHSKKMRLEEIEKFGFSKNKIRIGYIGRISAKKGWDTYVKMASLLSKTRDNIQFIMVGSGNEDEKLDTLIDELELKSEIIRLGLKPPSELAQIYNCLDLFIFPTEREGESLGLVALEAMACGVPVIASNYAAPRYYVKDGVNGFKFELGNVENLAFTVCNFIDLPNNIKEKICKNAHNTGSQYYSNNILDRLKNLF